ncbi:transcription initiation factor IIA, gamma subunit-domain-containing protein [Cercophora samala]|uniref:Transcription initiation factor IIA subunit 2 n=1 Tax=Cercophora samala TaxID=330535 RepID=A0AA40DF52_9PEZI|nr:transcription initiation factor IIA, gamma subunit-domain-containing protein [Cercophora samala]
MAASNSFYDLYRHGSLGMTLTDALDELIENNSIAPQLAMKVLTQFDRVVAETLQERVKSRLTFKGSLDTYRFCDEVWTFLIRNVTFKMDGTQGTVVADKVKIVSCSAKRNDDK